MYSVNLFLWILIWPKCPDFYRSWLNLWSNNFIRKFWMFIFINFEFYHFCVGWLVVVILILNLFQINKQILTRICHHALFIFLLACGNWSYDDLVGLFNMSRTSFCLYVSTSLTLPGIRRGCPCYIISYSSIYLDYLFYCRVSFLRFCKGMCCLRDNGWLVVAYFAVINNGCVLTWPITTTWRRPRGKARAWLTIKLPLLNFFVTCFGPFDIWLNIE